MVTSTRLIPNTKPEKGKALPRVGSNLVEQSACGRGGHENCAALGHLGPTAISHSSLRISTAPACLPEEGRIAE
jgi:hypothetical protein